MEFSREKFKQKINHIVDYEIRKGLVKDKTDFAKKYEISPQALNKYIKKGSVGYVFVAKICKAYRLTSDFLVYDEDTFPPNKLPE